jgi:hypothetical protein
MKRVVLLVSVVAMGLMATAQNASASILWQTLVGNTVNTYGDLSRESIVDVNGDGVFNPGDVVLGFLRLDEREVPPGAPIGDDDLYAVFSSELATSTSVTAGPFTVYSQTFIPTTVVGLRLQDLVTLPGGLGPGTPAAAMYEDVGINLFSTAPPTHALSTVAGDYNNDGLFNTLDFIDRIEAGNLDLVAGFQAPNTPDPNGPLGPPLNGPDFWSSVATVGATDPIASLAVLNSLTLGTPVGATFQNGMTILWQPGFLLDEQVPVFDPLTGQTNLHGLGTVTGSTSGASNVTYAGAVGNPFGAAIDTSGADYTAANVYPLADEAKVQLFAVPEPLSIAIWSLIAASAIAVTGRRWMR